MLMSHIMTIRRQYRLISMNILPMREARRAAANAVANIGNDRSVSESPSCLSYSPGIKTVTIETQRKTMTHKIIVLTGLKQGIK